jgi:hypothetical protein
MDCYTKANLVECVEKARINTANSDFIRQMEPEDSAEFLMFLDVFESHFYKGLFLMEPVKVNTETKVETMLENKKEETNGETIHEGS